MMNGRQIKPVAATKLDAYQQYQQPDNGIKAILPP